MKNAFVTFFQRGLNNYIALDPESTSRLEKLQGKIIQIELLNLAPIFELNFTKKEIKISLDKTISPDTVIKGSPLSLLRMTVTRENRKQFFAEDVSIQGDLDLGQEVINLFDQLEIDWEELLAQRIGDVPAHHLGRFARGVKDWCQHTRELLTQDMNDYLHEEKTWFPTREMLQEFFDEIDKLRMDADRLDARVKNLER